MLNPIDITRARQTEAANRYADMVIKRGVPKSVDSRDFIAADPAISAAHAEVEAILEAREARAGRLWCLLWDLHELGQLPYELDFILLNEWDPDDELI